MANHRTLITWNVNRLNKKIPQLVSHGLSYNPDILCLQEVPPHMMPFLMSQNGYYTSFSYDFKSKIARASAYNCILTKARPTKKWIIPYANAGTPSLYGKIVHQKLFKRTEYHTALVVEVGSGKNKVRYITARFSSAVSTSRRLGYLQIVLDALDTKAYNFFCGDLNILDVHAFNLVSGWTRGFTRADYKIHERKTFEKLCNLRGFTNIFKGTSTNYFKIPLFQLDHILIPNGTRVIKQFVSRKRFGSDHRMLLAQVEL